MNTLKDEDIGIIYCNTRGDTERIHKKLLENNIKAGLYHAGLKKKERIEIQEEFFSNKYKVLVATNAFGMGLDKEDISFIVHYNTPSNLESYYQEIGRGGRNGKPCYCLLLFGLKDVMVNKALGKERVYFKWRLEEKEKQLKEMTAFTHTDNCYKTFILNHFGEEKEPCGNCANCLGNFKERDVTKEAQMILSAYYHTKGLYGSSIIAGILTGKNTVKIKEKKLNELSVYALMKKEKEAFILRIIGKLQSGDYLETKSNGRFGDINLITDKGKSLLKGEEKFILKERLN